jgi:serine/threonine protein kinase/TPR repeat protein
MHALLSSLHATRPLEARLEQIIERAIGDLENGLAVDLVALEAEHPEYAEQLRELLPMVAALVGMGGALAEPTIPAGPTRGIAPPPPYGQLGDFRLIRELGRGGMGTVYEAEQITMGRRVALKVLPFAALAHEKSLQRFRNEVRAAAALDHPHIVSVYSVGEERGVHFFAMQLIRGQTLADLIGHLRNPGQPASSGAGNNNPTVDSASTGATQPIADAQVNTARDTRHTAERYRTAARMGIQAAEALQHAHDAGVLHRDIKPNNLMLDGDGQLYITDFGLARIEADAGMTMTGDIVGTLRYMAPEQALAKRVVIDHRADVYSLGATLYELLTLEPAFAETDRSELLKQIAFEEPKPLRKGDRRLSADLETIVLKAMAKNPEERYQTSQRLAEDLTAFLENQPIKARPPTVWHRAVKWSRRHQALVASVAASAAALIVISMGVLLYSNIAIDKERSEKSAALIRETTLRRAAEASERQVQVTASFYEGNYEAVESHLNAISQDDHASGEFITQYQHIVGFWHELHQRWRDAVAHYDVVLQTENGLAWELRTMDYIRYVPVYAMLGDVPRFEQLRQAMIAKYHTTTNPIVAHRICRLSLLLPADEAILTQLEPLYPVILAGQEDTAIFSAYIEALDHPPSLDELALRRHFSKISNKNYSAWNSHTLALFEYRRGNYAHAIAWSRRCQESGTLEGDGPPRTAGALAIEAMAHNRLHQDAEARIALAQAHIFNCSPELGIAAHWGYDLLPRNIFNLSPVHNEITSYLLLSEADELIGGEPKYARVGLAPMQFLLGNIYAQGVGTDLNFAEALKSYQQAASQDLPAAQVHLAEILLTGVGVAADPIEGKKWLICATDQFSWTCSLGMNAARDLSVSLNPAEEIIAAHRPHAGNLATIGAVSYRAGDYALAERRLRKSIEAFASEPDGESTVLYPKLLLAMTKWQEDDKEMARRMLKHIGKDVDAALQDSLPDWDRRATLLLLRREAQELIESPDNAGTPSGDQVKDVSAASAER